MGVHSQVTLLLFMGGINDLIRSKVYLGVLRSAVIPQIAVSVPIGAADRLF